MLPKFLIEETAVRESGESAVFDIGPSSSGRIILTFGITHAVEQESIELEIFGSEGRETWSLRPLLRVPAKYYCGTYQISMDCPGVSYLKAAWRVTRWSRTGEKPFFRFYIFAEPAGGSVAMAGAA